MPEKKNAITGAFVQSAARRWWKVAAPLGLVLGVAAAGTVFLLFEPKFEARYRLQMNQEYIVFPRERQPNLDYIGTQAELIRSPLVLEPVLADPEIARVPEIAGADDPIAWMTQNVGVRAVGGAQLFDVTYTARSPRDASRVVNRIVDSYFALLNDQDDKRNRQVTDLLDREKVYWSDEVKKLRERVRSLSIAATGKDPDNVEEHDVIGRDPLSEMRIQLATLGAQEAELKARIEALQEPSDAVRVPLSRLEEAVERNAQVQHWKTALLELQVKERQFLSSAREGRLTSLHEDLKSRIALAQEQLTQTREAARKQIREELETALNFRHDDDLQQHQTDLRAVQAQIKHLDQRFDEEFKAKVATAQRAKGDTVELEFARVELEQAKEIHDLIATRIIHLRTEEPLSPVLRLLAAKPPTLPVERLPYRDLALAFLAAFSLPFLAAVAWELHLRRVTDSRQLAEESNLPVVGEIATFPARSMSARFRSRRFQRGVRIFEESIDSLRTYLVLSHPLEEIRVLAVASADSGEGKTSVAAKLALSVARATHAPTLLIDGDTRRPDVHAMFDIPQEPGLVEVLAGDVPFEEAVNVEYSPNLHILPAGNLRTNPHRLFGNGELRALLNEARGRYRYVIIDTPPVLPASEALLLAAAADASLLCVMRDHSRMDKVGRAHERLKGAGANVVGAVLTGVPTECYAEIYGDYSYERRS